MKLLICEDEKEIREGLKDTIDWSSMGVDEVGTASNGMDAQEMIPVFSPDIILTDIRMPLMDGLALCQYAYENHPRIKLIILSGYGDFEYAQRAIRYRVENYFLKPVPIKELTALVGRLCTEITDRSKPLGNNYTEPPPYVESGLSARVKEFIERRSGEPINIDSIADALGLNASYLSHAFRKETGMRCNEFLNHVRIRKAKELLLNGDRTVEEIAELTGFSNSGYFITVFKKKSGMTPARFRDGR